MGATESTTVNSKDRGKSSPGKYQSKTLNAKKISPTNVEFINNLRQHHRKKSGSGFSSKTLPASAVSAISKHRAASASPSMHAKRTLPPSSDAFTSYSNATFASRAKSKRKEDIEKTRKHLDATDFKLSAENRRRRARSMHDFKMKSKSLRNSWKLGKRNPIKGGSWKLEKEKKLSSKKWSMKNRSQTLKPKKFSSLGSRLSSPRRRERKKERKLDYEKFQASDRLESRVKEMETTLEKKNQTIKSLESQVGSLQEKVLDYQKRLAIMRKKHGKLKFKAKGKVEKFDMAAITEYKQMESKVRNLQYQVFYGNSKKDREIETLTEQVKEYSAKFATESKKEIFALKEKLQNVKDKAVETWLFNGDMEYI
ncbi:hypothetical protein AAMO2058_001326600 [Amorphochlora amoebiformis]|mmetsp:Transcript_4969/g.7552  ORF Transcript_4969/g.7552 Transcript_4969/m.7552 type:complete len:368 (-) Transcript_4969:246-1349(-)